MTLHRFAIIRLSRSLLILLISLQVVACSSGTEGSSEIATLKWIAPSEREDGTPISMAEIAGYHVYYLTSEGEYTKELDIADSDTMQATLSIPSTGTNYIVVTAYDIDGRESAYSEVVSITTK